jgi:hypothetical protein
MDEFVRFVVQQMQGAVVPLIKTEAEFSAAMSVFAHDIFPVLGVAVWKHVVESSSCFTCDVNRLGVGPKAERGVFLLYVVEPEAEAMRYVILPKEYFEMAQIFFGHMRCAERVLPEAATTFFEKRRTARWKFMSDKASPRATVATLEMLRIAQDSKELLEMLRDATAPMAHERVFGRVKTMTESRVAMVRRLGAVDFPDPATYPEIARGMHVFYPTLPRDAAPALTLSAPWAPLLEDEAPGPVDF